MLSPTYASFLSPSSRSSHRLPVFREIAHEGSNSPAEEHCASQSSLTPRESLSFSDGTSARSASGAQAIPPEELRSVSRTVRVSATDPVFLHRLTSEISRHWSPETLQEQEQDLVCSFADLREAARFHDWAEKVSGAAAAEYTYPADAARGYVDPLGVVGVHCGKTLATRTMQAMESAGAVAGSQFVPDDQLFLVWFYDTRTAGEVRRVLGGLSVSQSQSKVADWLLVLVRA